MDKLLLSLSLVVLLTSLTVNSAPTPTSKLISAIDSRQKKLNSQPADDDVSAQIENADSNRTQEDLKTDDQASEYDAEEASEKDDDNDQRRALFIRRREDAIAETGLRRNKMISFNPYSALPFGYPSYAAQAFYPSEFYDDFADFYGGFGEDEEIMSRTNSGNRRRPANGNYKNSPIFYIRLPPTPYMFVPGLGYVSQPPSYSPMSPVPVQQPISPFFNLPLDFISNGKPTNIYQWASPPQQQYVQQPQFSNYQQPAYQQPGYQQPAYQRPQRPQRPYSQRPMNPFIQESKVTNLKGPFLFNGRPEEIFLLQNSYNPRPYNSIYSDPRLPSPGYY